MKPERFNSLMENRVKKCKLTLGSKAKEYSRNNDRLWNFKVAARRRGITPELALDGMRAKHEVSILDMIDNPEKVTISVLDEKIGDAINYLLLLEGLFVERIESGYLADVDRIPDITPDNFMPEYYY